MSICSEYQREHGHHHKSRREDARAATAQDEIKKDQEERAERGEKASFAKRNYPWLLDIVNSVTFESGIGFMILFNCITIGIEVQMCPPSSSARFLGSGTSSEECPTEFLFIMELIFTTFFLIEFILRVLCFGPGYYLFSPANLFDAFLVWVTGVLPAFILGPLGLNAGDSVRSFTALRAFRLMRVCRVVQNNPHFKEMLLLLRGLADSSRTLLWTVVVILFINYIFAIFAVVIVGDDKEFVGNEVQPAFSGLDHSLFTLLQVITGDSWASGIARPVMAVKPWMWVYFTLYVGVAMLVLLNLITAVIVENALYAAKADEDNILQALKEKRDEDINMLGELFKQIDKDGSGELDEAEFREAVNRPDIAAKFLVLEFEEKEIPGLFHDLDTSDDGHGTLTVDEFIDGLRAMQGEAKSKDLIRTVKGVERVQKKLDKVQDVSSCPSAAVAAPAQARNSTRMLGKPQASQDITQTIESMLAKHLADIKSFTTSAVRDEIAKAKGEVRGASVAASDGTGSRPVGAKKAAKSKAKSAAK